MTRPKRRTTRKTTARRAPARATKKAPARRTAAKRPRRRNPSVPCAGSKKLDRYRNAMVLHNGEWVQLSGCAITSGGTRAYSWKKRGAKRATTVSKRAVRQKASRSPARVKGVRARKRR